MNIKHNVKIKYKVYLNTIIMIIVKTHNKNYRTIIIPIFNLADSLQETTYDTEWKKHRNFKNENKNLC